MINISDKLKNKINQIPELPGIYKMLDSKGNIIYVGKSKCLKKRVKTYFLDNPKWEKVKKMVHLINDIDFEVTDTHLEAMLLECKLIKSIKPIFNSQMKNDKRYIYMKIEDFNRYNSIKVVSMREDNSYGPFRRKFAIYEIIDSFKNLYPIKKINLNYFFDYHLFPITMDKEIFNENKNVLLDIFSNDKNFEAFIKNLIQNMKNESSLCNFEAASMYRDMIQNLRYINEALSRYRKMSYENILLKLPIENGLKLFFISKGHIILKEKYCSATDTCIDSFIEKGMKLALPFIDDVDEKSQMDYRDILYSEIMNLSDESVIFLK